MVGFDELLLFIHKIVCLVLKVWSFGFSDATFAFELIIEFYFREYRTSPFSGIISVISCLNRDDISRYQFLCVRYVGLFFVYKYTYIFFSLQAAKEPNRNSAVRELSFSGISGVTFGCWRGNDNVACRINIITFRNWIALLTLAGKIGANE